MSQKTCAVGLIFVFLLSGCGEDVSPPRDIEHEIDALLLSGETARAELLCKEAIRNDPDNPALRELYGDIYLVSGDGQYAEIAFRRAIELGADAASIHPRIARALLLQQKFLDVLRLEMPDVAVDESAHYEFAVIQLRAQLDASGGQDANLQRTARELITALDTRSGAAPWVRTLQNELQSLADSSEVIASAYAHARCLVSAVESYNAVSVPGADDAGRAVIRVGATRSIKTPADAAIAASDGSIVLIEAGDYPGGVAFWPQNNLSIIGSGQRPHIKAAGEAIRDRDIWLFEGDDILVENIEFSGARSVKYRNGAGIRHTGSNLTVRHSYFHDSENGILTWKAPAGEIVIEYSEFARNGFGDGQSHNVYVGETERLVFRYNYSHASAEGHLLKTRARFNDIRYNRLTGEEGLVSYVIDLPNGGIASIVGNEIEKAATSRNPYAITFGQEGLVWDENQLIVVHNSFYNRYDKTILIRNTSETPAIVANNLIGGAPSGLVTGEYVADGNQSLPEHGMIDPREYDFLLTDAASAIDAAIPFDLDSSIPPVIPTAEYVHPVSMRSRGSVAQPDIGAHEFCAQRTR